MDIVKFNELTMNIDNLYIKAGIRNLSDFSKVKYTNVTDLKIPKDSIIHVLPHSGDDYGPMPIEALLYELVKNQSNIFIKHLEDFKAIEFDYRPVHINKLKLINDYQRKNRMFRLLRNEQLVLTNNSATLAINYCLLQHLIKFNKSVYSEYYLNKNLFNILNSTVSDYSKISNRVQFIECEIPTSVKSLEHYKRILSNKYINYIEDIDVSEYWLLGLLNYVSDETSDDYDFISYAGCNV